MQKMPVSAAAELAVQGAELLAAGLDDCEPRLELADWISDNVQDEGLLREAKIIAKDAGSEALAYFTRAIRLVTGTREITTDGVREYVMLIAMPVFLSGDPLEAGASTTDWGCRQVIERYLETALGLRMLSTRLSTFPVDYIALSQLSAVQQQRLLTDLHMYSDSRLMTPAPLIFDGDERGLLWPGIIKFRVDSYVEDFTRFKVGITSPNILKFRKFAGRELTRSLTPMAQNPVITVYPPVQMADAFCTYRLLNLSRITRLILKEKKGISTILYRFKSGRLTLWFVRAGSIFEDVAEFDFSGDKPGPVLSALQYLQRSTGTPVHEAKESPTLPSCGTGAAH